MLISMIVIKLVEDEQTVEVKMFSSPEVVPRRLKATGQKRTATTGLLAPGSCSAGLHI